MLLQGEYMFTGSTACINSANGFDSNLAPNPGGAFAPFAQALPNQLGFSNASASEFTGTFTRGTFAVSNIPPITGRISEDLQTIIVSHVTPGVETISPTGFPTRERVCYRERVLVKLKRGR